MSTQRDGARAFWIGVGGIAPIAVAIALVTLRDVVLNANVALVLVVVVVGVAAAGGREAAAVAALSSALSFDFFHTEPYLKLEIASSDDVETTVLLLAVGLVVGHIAARARRARRSAAASASEIRRIHHVAQLAATGAGAEDVILVAQEELEALLHLRRCRFEAPPFGLQLPRLERSGAVATAEHTLRAEGFELPAGGAELPVLGRGQLLGRFVLEPEEGVGVSLEERVVAVAIADQVGTVLAAPMPREKGTRGG